MRQRIGVLHQAEHFVAFNFSVQTPTGGMQFLFEPGTSLLFVGANGSGKTRLAVAIEEMLDVTAHRIAGHRALNLNPAVPKLSERMALNGLRTGNAGDGANINQRRGHRWAQIPEVQLLNDYDFLVQALFADQANTALDTHKNVRAGVTQKARPTKFEKLTDIWARVLPQRTLEISGLSLIHI